MDPQVCYICAMTSVFYSRNLFKTKSKHSETRIYDFICKFLGKIPSVRQRQRQSSSSTIVDNDDCVCVECLGKIDEYDLATITSQRVESELRGLLLHAESSVNQVLKGSDGDAATIDNNDLLEPSIETIEMLDQFKVENSCNESNEPNESILANDDDYDNDHDYDDDGSLVSDSDEDYRPHIDLKKKKVHRTVVKMKRKTDNPREQKQQQKPNSHPDQQLNLKCAVCNVQFKRYLFLLNFDRLRIWPFPSQFT